VRHQFLDVPPRCRPHRFLVVAAVHLATPEPSDYLPHGFPPPETTPAPPIFPRRRSRTATFLGYPWRPFLGGLFCAAACVAGNFARVRRRRGPLLRIFRPGHGNHASPLFMRQSQREPHNARTASSIQCDEEAGLVAPRLSSDTPRGSVSTKNSFP
jgi:hypothetical protein